MITQSKGSGKRHRSYSTASRPRRRARTARPEDLHRILEIERECFPGPEGLSRSQIEKLSSLADFIMLVLEDDGDIVGFAIAEASEAKARLITVDVDPGRRGMGYGAELLVALENEARKRGSESMRLEVRVNNAAARKLYEKAGYSETRVIKGYYFYPDQGSVDAVEMEKRLV